MHVKTFKYKPEDVACVLCTEYIKKLGCTALSCTCLAERMEAGTVGYAEAMAELFRCTRTCTSVFFALPALFPAPCGRTIHTSAALNTFESCWATEKSGTRQHFSPRCIC